MFLYLMYLAICVSHMVNDANILRIKVNWNISVQVTCNVNDSWELFVTWVTRDHWFVPLWPLPSIRIASNHTGVVFTWTLCPWPPCWLGVPWSRRTALLLHVLSGSRPSIWRAGCCWGVHTHLLYGQWSEQQFKTRDISKGTTLSVLHMILHEYGLASIWVLPPVAWNHKQPE